MHAALNFETSPSISSSKLKVLQSLRNTSDLPLSFKPVSAPSFDPPAVRLGIAPARRKTIGEVLFAATASVKVWTSRVAMHLDRETRDRLFRQIDALHEADEWADSDAPVSIESYKCFVRAVVYHKVNSRPALALMPNGNLLAMWQDNADKLTVEFLPASRTRWLVQNATPNGPERATGTSPIERLREVLQPYNADRWFDGR
ncbi:hypothetical protein [Sphingomonas sp. PWP1-2]|uniref:hypothetical protein n=1 Tax=Sphingomonas sp. PWP1-2 TaxID=2804558 RepID=UPI003CEC92DC